LFKKDGEKKAKDHLGGNLKGHKRKRSSEKKRHIRRKREEENPL